MKLKYTLKKLYYKIKPLDVKYINVSLVGVPIQVLEGTIRSQVDQDDTWWFYLAKHHNIIYDIGCNIGYTALLALIQNPNRNILLVDPNPKALQNAAINIINNGLGSKVQYKAAFVGEELDSTIKFYTIGSGAAGSMYASHAETASSMNSFIEVNTVTLDHLFSFYQLKPDLVKIDVEGAETFVMKGAKKLALQTQCTFFIEMHNLEGLAMEAAGENMIDWCLSVDYRVWYLKTGELLESGKTIKNRGKCHLLLLPKNKNYPNYLNGVEQNAPLPKTI